MTPPVQGRRRLRRDGLRLLVQRLHVPLGLLRFCEEGRELEADAIEGLVRGVHELRDGVGVRQVRRRLPKERENLVFRPKRLIQGVLAAPSILSVSRYSGSPLRLLGSRPRRSRRPTPRSPAPCAPAGRGTPRRSFAGAPSRAPPGSCVTCTRRPQVVFTRFEGHLKSGTGFESTAAHRGQGFAPPED